MTNIITVKCDDIERQLSGAIDITKLKQYNEKVKELHKCTSPMYAPMYLRDFILAYDVTNTYLMKVTRLYEEAESNVKAAESIAYLDRAGEELKKRDIKDSSEARKRYIPLDPDVIRAHEIKAKTEALLVFLKNKMIEYKSCHDSAKKMAYHTGESGYEGM
jgi:hypothetical protein